MKIPEMPPETLATIRQLILETRMRDAAEEFCRVKPCSIDFAKKVVLRIFTDVLAEPGNSHLLGD
jgi:hypothetical protein